MQKNKILFCINKLGVGGAENVFIKDANALKKLGCDIFFCLVFGDIEEQLLLSKIDISKDRILFCKAKHLFDFTALSNLAKFVKKNNIEVVYSTLNEANIFAKMSALFGHKASLIIREANIADPKPIKFKILDLILNIFVKKIVCVSLEVKNSLLKYLWMYRSKMFVLPNGVDIPVGQKEYSKTTWPVKFINVGNLTAKKGQKFLIEAAALVQKESQDLFCLDIIGDGVEKENLEKLIEDKSLTKIVNLLGRIDRDKVDDYYKRADVFVLSSIWEGSPNVLLEAMSHGLVCISTRVSGAMGMIEDGISGYLVQKADSEALARRMLAVIKNKEQFQTVGNNARRKMIEEFSFSVYMKKLESILSS